MSLARQLVLAAVAASLLGGCSSFNNILGQTDNTVLPGKREDAIPGRPSFPEQTATASTTRAPAPGGNETYCAPDDAACKPPATSGDTFKDPQ